MLKKPEGEARNPTDFWSGMGFSKSMPESAIRDKLNHKKLEQQFAEPPMATTYEVSIIATIDTRFLWQHIMNFLF